MDTVFVKEVRPYGPAHFAGLQTGDRLLSVNGMPVAGTPYNRVVTTIQQAPSSLTLSVVPKECDILQTVSNKHNIMTSSIVAFRSQNSISMTKATVEPAKNLLNKCHRLISVQ